MRMMTTDDDPIDVISKIDDFISNKDNTESLMDDVTIVMTKLDNMERVITGMKDEGYRKEMLGYLQTSRLQVMNILDAVDSMLEV